jgi:hypothetical protein
MVREVTYTPVVVLRITLRGTVWGGVLLEALRGKAGNAKYDRSVRWQPGSRLGGAVAARVRGNHFAMFLNDVYSHQLFNRVFLSKNFNRPVSQ